MQRTIKFNNVLNFRDLGGYYTKNGITKSNVIYRSAKLCDMDEEDLRHFHELGIKSVLDLRSKEESINRPDKTKVLEDVIHYNVPVNGDGRIPKDNNDMANMYMEMLEHPEKSKEVLMTILNAPKPLLIHCAVGKDRTGIYANILLELAGVDLLDRQAHYLESYSHLRQYQLDNWEHIKTLPSCLFTPSLEYLENFNKLFYEKYGTLEKYLEYVGLNEKDIARLRSLLF